MEDMPMLPPLLFEPILRQYVWGGRRLESELGKRLPPGDRFAESWEIVDHGADQSVVAGGPFSGMTLHELVAAHGESLFGAGPRPRQFPLLFKFLDAHQTLSVQVHPNDEQAARLDPPDLGKTEAWVVLAADPGSKIYAGLRSGVDRQQLQQAIDAGGCDTCLHVFEPAVGDCLLIEAGTVHALGAGLLMAEIQQASDTTFRLFDWNRVDRDGRPRQLHIQQALDVIRYARGPVGPQRPQATDRPHVERLVACDKFVLDRWRFERAEELKTGGRFHVVSIVDGGVDVATGDVHHSLSRGRTILLPASCERVLLEPQGRAVLLDMYLPATASA
jgi:mannose-6-phosphate isomerase